MGEEDCECFNPVNVAASRGYPSVPVAGAANRSAEIAKRVQSNIAKIRGCVWTLKGSGFALFLSRALPLLFGKVITAAHSRHPRTEQGIRHRMFSKELPSPRRYEKSFFAHR